MSPEEYADIIYWKYAEDEELSNDQVIRCCNITLDLMIKEADELIRFYWTEVKSIINKRAR
jgi:hypothetical protein